MFHSIVILLLSLIIVSSENLNGIFVIDSCECNSTDEKCEPTGPFIFDQQRSSVAVRFGAKQVGVGTLGSNRLDLYLNQNRCKGIWNGKSRLAELKCQHPGGTICATKLRCVSGACLDDTSITISSSTIKTISSVLLIISSLLILLY
jgi:hypothetical protein